MMNQHIYRLSTSVQEHSFLFVYTIFIVLAYTVNIISKDHVG